MEDEARAVVPLADHSPVLPTRAVPLTLDDSTTVPLSHLCCYCLPWIYNPPIHPREWWGDGICTIQIPCVSTYIG